MIWTKRRLLIAVAMSDTLTSKQFYELFIRLEEDMSLNESFVLGDLKYSLPEETNKWIESMDWDLEIKKLQDGEVIAFVDGSHSLDADGKEKYSFGVILVTNESEDSLYKAFVDNDKMESRNIAGEIDDTDFLIVL